MTKSNAKTPTGRKRGRPRKVDKEIVEPSSSDDVKSRSGLKRSMKELVTYSKCNALV